MRRRPLIAAALVLALAGLAALLLRGAVHTAMAKAAGETAGHLAWAQQRCRGDLTPGVTQALERYRGLRQSTYDFYALVVTGQLGSVAGQDVALMCDWLVEPYRKARSGFWIDDIAASLLRYPEPAWRDRPAAEN